jgi:hypothetical protein
MCLRLKQSDKVQTDDWQLQACSWDPVASLAASYV